jgi:hypothetical protein
MKGHSQSQAFSEGVRFSKSSQDMSCSQDMFHVFSNASELARHSPTPSENPGVHCITTEGRLCVCVRAADDTSDVDRDS